MGLKLAVVIYGNHLSFEKRYLTILKEVIKQNSADEINVYCNLRLRRILQNQSQIDVSDIPIKPLWGRCGEFVYKGAMLFQYLGQKSRNSKWIFKKASKVFFLVRRLVQGLLMSITNRRFNECDKVHYASAWECPQIFPKRPQLIFSFIHVQADEWLAKKTRLVKTIIKRQVICECLSADIARKVKRVCESEVDLFRIAPGSAVDPSRYIVSEKEDLIAFSGRLEKEKNPLLFLEVLLLIKKQHPHCKAVLMGNGSLQPMLEQFISENDLSGSVEIYYEPNPCQQLARALVFVSLQNINNYPSQALIEAMGCGCYTVASDVGETSLLISDTLETGDRVNLNKFDIAESIQKALHNREKTIEWGQNARRLVIEDHSPSRYAEHLYSIYKEDEH